MRAEDRGLCLNGGVRSVRLRVAEVGDSNDITLAQTAIRKAGGSVEGWQADFDSRIAVFAVWLPEATEMKDFLEAIVAAGVKL